MKIRNIVYIFSFLFVSFSILVAAERSVADIEKELEECKAELERVETINRECRELGNKYRSKEIQAIKANVSRAKGSLDVIVREINFLKNSPNKGKTQMAMIARSVEMAKSGVTGAKINLDMAKSAMKKDLEKKEKYAKDQVAKAKEEGKSEEEVKEIEKKFNDEIKAKIARNEGIIKKIEKDIENRIANLKKVEEERAEKEEAAKALIIKDEEEKKAKLEALEEKRKKAESFLEAREKEKKEKYDPIYDEVVEKDKERGAVFGKDKILKNKIKKLNEELAAAKEKEK